jgi:hypothetical protein
MFEIAAAHRDAQDVADLEEPRRDDEQRLRIDDALRRRVRVEERAGRVLRLENCG